MLTNRTFLLSALSGALFLGLTACGGGSTPNPLNTVEVVPALGAVYGATAQLFDSNGNLLSSCVTGAKGSATPGKCRLPVYVAVSGPAIVKLTLGGAIYYDEKSNSDIQVPPASTAALLSFTPLISASSSIGLTPLTTMATKIAGVGPDGKPATALTAGSIATAVATVNTALGLPATLNILLAPVAATSQSTIPTTGYGAVLAQMAKNTSFPDALSQANALAGAVSGTGVTNADTIVATNNVLSTYASSAVTIKPPVTNNTALASAAAAAASQLTSVLSSGNTGITGGTGTGS